MTNKHVFSKSKILISNHCNTKKEIKFDYGYIYTDGTSFNMCWFIWKLN